MDVNNLKKYSQEGQAIFEMLVFFPFLILLFTLIVTIGNSINGSINQQKATRAYFHYSHAGDSMGTPLRDVLQLNENGVQSVGFYAFGWKEKDINEEAIATCYKLNSTLSRSGNETCEEPVEGETKTEFIRVFTAYGYCAGLMTKFAGDSFNLSNEAGGVEACTNQ